MTRLNPFFPTEETLGINTDLYEITMAAAYFNAGKHEDWATFELFTRKLPKSRSFLVAAGLEQALHYILNLGFPDSTISYLRRLDMFEAVGDDFFDFLKSFRFTGHVNALPEGAVFFANEPILQVTAPVIEAQILETYLINTINFQSMVASKGARICLAAKDKSVIDFGSRRAHSPQAGALAARASFIGGCEGTSNLLAGYEMGIPVYGTMAHSFIQFFGEETDAFRTFYDTFPGHTTLLVDTYDTLDGVRKAAEFEGEVQGIRLDSGDLKELAFQSRELLDKGGKKEVRIFASGNLNEEKILSLSHADTPIDAYGVGTDLVVSTDAPTCDLIYKLVEVIHEGKVAPRVKVSEGKATMPYCKQVFRRLDDGQFAGDTIARWDEALPGERLLQSCVKDGKLIAPLPDVFQIKDYARRQIERLPTPYKRLHTAEEYPVEYSKKLIEAQKELQEEYA